MPRTSSDHEWACFAAEQAAEKGVKAVVQRLGGEPRGHSGWYRAISSGRML